MKRHTHMFRRMAWRHVAQDHPVKSQPNSFTCRSVDINNALEAGRFEANKYCIRGYGSSDIAWTAGPDRAVEEIQIVDDTLTLAGRCVQR